MKKLLSAILAVSMLCLLVGCSNNSPAANSAPASAASASAPQSEPAQSDAAQPAASASDASDSSENLPDEKTAANQVSQKGFLTGAFLNDAQRAKDEEGSEDQITYQIGCATVISARFGTRHATEAFMDEYAAGSDVGEPQDVDVAGTPGTRYHWESGANEDASVIDAVVAEANGSSLLFLVQNTKDAATGNNDAGPVQEAVDSWMTSLMVAE